MKVEVIQLNEKRNVTLTAYLQDVGGEFRTITKRPAMLVIPGGGYMFVSDREADPVAFEYLKAGFQTFILRYSVGEYGKWPLPLEDYEQAMELIRERADEWNILTDKIAVSGFSAGGHLAGAAATIARNKPAAAVLGYAVLNETVDELTEGAPRIYQEADYDTCPCFLFAARSDSVVPIKNTLDMCAALDQAGVTFECHIYPFGPHGFSTADNSIQNKDMPFCSRIPDWVDDSIGFLEDVLGKFNHDTTKEEILKKPAAKPHFTADGAAWLSTECTIGRIFGNAAAVEALSAEIEVMREEIEPYAPGMPFEVMMQICSSMVLGDLLSERHVHVDIDKMNEKLNKIPNI